MVKLYLVIQNNILVNMVIIANLVNLIILAILMNLVNLVILANLMILVNMVILAILVILVNLCKNIISCILESSPFQDMTYMGLRDAFRKNAIRDGCSTVDNSLDFQHLHT